MFEEENAQYLKELKAEKDELEKNYNENANAIKLLQNGKRKHIYNYREVSVTPSLWCRDLPRGGRAGQPGGRLQGAHQVFRHLPRAARQAHRQGAGARQGASQGDQLIMINSDSADPHYSPLLGNLGMRLLCRRLGWDHKCRSLHIFFNIMSTKNSLCLFCHHIVFMWEGQGKVSLSPLVV